MEERHRLLVGAGVWQGEYPTDLLLVEASYNGRVLISSVPPSRLDGRILSGICQLKWGYPKSAIKVATPATKGLSLIRLKSGVNHPGGENGKKIQKGNSTLQISSY